MDNEVSNRTEEEEKEVVVVEPIDQLQKNAASINAVQNTRRATKKAQTPHQKKMCAIEHERLVLMNEAYNELRLLLDMPAKASKAEIVKNTTLYIKTKTEALKKYNRATEVSGIQPDQTSSVMDQLLYCSAPSELTSITAEAWSQATQTTSVEPERTEKFIATESCPPQHNFNELGSGPHNYTIYVINQNCNQSSCWPASSDLPTNQQTFLTINSLSPFNIEIGPEINLQNFENLAITDGASQNQASADSASPVGSTDKDGATDEPFGGPKSNIDGSGLLPHQYDLYARLSEQLSAWSLDRTVHDALEHVFGDREDNF